jgi:hypothetical protein
VVHNTRVVTMTRKIFSLEKKATCKVCESSGQAIHYKCWDYTHITKYEGQGKDAHSDNSLHEDGDRQKNAFLLMEILALIGEKASVSMRILLSAFSSPLSS